MVEKTDIQFARAEFSEQMAAYFKQLFPTGQPRMTKLLQGFVESTSNNFFDLESIHKIGSELLRIYRQLDAQKMLLRELGDLLDLGGDALQSDDMPEYEETDELRNFQDLEETEQPEKLLISSRLYIVDECMCNTGGLESIDSCSEYNPSRIERQALEDDVESLCPSGCLIANEPEEQKNLLSQGTFSNVSLVSSTYLELRSIASSKFSTLKNMMIQNEDCDDSQILENFIPSKRTVLDANDYQSSTKQDISLYKMSNLTRASEKEVSFKQSLRKIKKDAKVRFLLNGLTG